MENKEINLMEVLNKRDEVGKFYKRMYDRHRLSNQFLEIYHNKYGNKKENRGSEKG